MTIIRTGIALAVVAILTGCQSAEQPTAAPAVANLDIATLKQQWEGKWPGTWSNGCSGSIMVSDVGPESAVVLYEWGICDKSESGSYVDHDATIAGDQLTVHLGRNIHAAYSHIDENTLRGDYSGRQDGTAGAGIFRRDG